MTALTASGPPPAPLFHVVLHQPEIPNNTGNIGRTCVALGCALHLVRPLGFSLEEKARRRAGLDYWPRVDLREHAAWDAYLAASAGSRRWLATTRSARPVYDVDFQPGDHLVFGGETRGLPGDILDAHHERCFSLPMLESERSLNLATAVCAVAYVALGRVLAAGGASLDAAGRLVGPQGAGIAPNLRERET